MVVVAPISVSLTPETLLKRVSDKYVLHVRYVLLQDFLTI